MGSALCTVLKAVISANGSFAGDIQIAATPFSLQIFPPLPAPPPPPRGKEDKGSSLQSPSEASLAEDAQLPGTASAARAADPWPGCLAKERSKAAAKPALGEQKKLPHSRSRSRG